MSIVKDVQDALKAVAEGIEHIQTVAKAVRDGREYLKVEHPDVQQDLAKMCAEMRNTTVAIASASAVLTHFRFTVAGTAVDTEPRKFNDHLIAHKEKAALVSTSLQALRGHCHVIEKHADKLRDKAKSLKLGARFLRLFGIDSRKRDQQVEAALRQIYDEEMQGYRLVGQLSFALQRSLDEIAKSLGPPGSMLPTNVPAAAALLGEYADQFSRLETTCNYLTLELQISISALEEQV